MMIDIDHFKPVNDQFGHQAGDRVLVSLGEIISETVRESDYVARYGGEEFLVVAPYTSLLDATELSERLRKQVELAGFKLPDVPDEIRLTVSIGVASLGQDIDNIERLVHVADDNLYRAKAAGRNRVVHGMPEA
jgi:diguanylate cyclase (GGDEF)-like protein